LSKLQLKTVRFIKSLASVQDIMAFKRSYGHRPLFAFVGKSNVGKSSLINHLTQHQHLAKVSSMPGKTQLINLFEAGSCVLIDLPGYGFSQVSRSLQASWDVLMGGFFEQLSSKLHLFLLIDPKKPIGQEDFHMMAHCLEHQIPFQIIFTKIDQINKTLLATTLRPRVQELNSFLSYDPPLILYSTAAKEGRLAVIHSIESSIAEPETTS
jgi:GTP-binding protein